MKKLWVLAVLLAAPAIWGQVTQPNVTAIIPGTGTTCSTNVAGQCTGAVTINSSGGTGTVTSVTGTTNQIDVATGTTTPVISLDPNFLASPPSTGYGSTTPEPVAATTVSATGNASIATGTDSASAVTIGTGANAANYIAFSGSRAFVGYNGGVLLIQGAAAKAIEFFQGSTVSTTPVAVIDTSSNFGVGSNSVASNDPFYVTAAGAAHTASLTNTGCTTAGVVTSTSGGLYGCSTLATAGALTTAGTGLSASVGTVSSNAVYQLSFQPGLLTSVTGTIAVFSTVSKASTVDNIVGSAYLFSCVSNPTITMYECGTSATCASPTAIGTVTVTAAGTRTNGTITSAAVTAGDSIGWALTAGTCTSLDISATAQVHSN